MNEVRPTELQLRAEIEELKRRLEEQNNTPAASHSKSVPSRRLLWSLGFFLLALMVTAFFAGYLPRQRRQQVLAAEAKAEVESLPLATVTTVTRGPARAQLVLPGNLQPVTE